MFGLGMPEVLMILAIALIVIGPKKLPDLAKTLGRAMGEFKRSAQDFKRSLDVETTVKDIKDVADPKVDLEGIIKDVNAQNETTADSREGVGSEDSDKETADNTAAAAAAADNTAAADNNTAADDDDTDDTPADEEPDKADTNSEYNKNDPQ